MFGDLVSLDYSQPDLQFDDPWSSLAPTFQSGLTSGVDFSMPSYNFSMPSGGMGIGPSPSPSFQPPSQPAPMSFPPTGTPPGMPAGLPPAPPAQAQAQLPIGGGGRPDEGRSGGAPRTGGAGGAAAGPAQYQPGASQQPAQQGGFDWKKMLGGMGGQAAGSLIQGGIGLGASALGSALAPKPKNQGGGQQPAPAPAQAGPAPAPLTPTGTPNMGPPTPPLPGAQWSPLLGKSPAPSGAGGSAAGLEAQRRMRRGGQTGGMALY